MKVSLCCTVKNEEESIQIFLRSIMEQTRLPDEIVIVDGGSNDKTIYFIKSFQKNYPLIKLIIKEGVNIAEGRNISIKNSRYDFIVTADAGVVYDREWFNKIISKFDNEIDFVSGFYKPYGKNLFEESVGYLLYPPEEIIQWDKFVPSARSSAFKKSVWVNLNGYCEDLPLGIGEDTLFCLMAFENKYRFAYAKDAICYWRPRGNFKSLFRQYYLYSKGAAAGGFAKYFLFTAYGVNPMIVIFWNIKKLFKDKKFLHLLLGIPIFLTILVAKVIGILSGIFNNWVKSEV